MYHAVVIIDDSKLDTYLARRHLGSAVPAIVTAQNARDGASLVSTDSALNVLAPDGGCVLVLLDIRMPGGDGWLVLDELERSAASGDLTPERVHVVVLTSSQKSEDRERALQSRFVVQYNVKPISRESVVGLGVMGP